MKIILEFLLGAYMLAPFALIYFIFYKNVTHNVEINSLNESIQKLQSEIKGLENDKY